MKSEGSLPCSQEFATGAYTEPEESNPRPICLRCILLLSFHLHLGFPCSLFLCYIYIEPLYKYSLVGRLFAIGQTSQ